MFILDDEQICSEKNLSLVVVHYYKSDFNENKIIFPLWVHN